jgi:hypothetical protein
MTKSPRASSAIVRSGRAASTLGRQFGAYGLRTGPDKLRDCGVPPAVIHDDDLQQIARMVDLPDRIQGRPERLRAPRGWNDETDAVESHLLMISLVEDAANGARAMRRSQLSARLDVGDYA